MFLKLLLILFFIFFGKVVFSQNITDWTYYSTFSILDRSGATLNDTIVTVSFPYSTYLSNNWIRPDCGDIRFYSEDYQSLPYYIESCGMLSAEARYAIGTTCITDPSQAPGWDSMTSYGINNWWSFDPWNCDKCSMYVRVRINVTGTAGPMYLQVYSYGATQKVWVNGIEHVPAFHENFTICNREPPQAYTVRLYDLTGLLNPGLNEIFIWCSDDTDVESCWFRIVSHADGLVLDRNGNYTLPVRIHVRVPQLRGYNITRVYMYHGNPNATSASSLNSTFIYRNTTQFYPISSPILYFNDPFTVSSSTLSARMDIIFPVQGFSYYNLLIPYYIERIEIPYETVPGIDLHNFSIGYFYVDHSIINLTTFTSEYILNNYIFNVSRSMIIQNNNTLVLTTRTPIIHPLTRNLVLVFARINNVSTTTSGRIRVFSVPYRASIITTSPSIVMYPIYSTLSSVSYTDYVPVMNIIGYYARVPSVLPIINLTMGNLTFPSSINISVVAPLGYYRISRNNLTIPMNVSISSTYPLLTCSLVLSGIANKVVPCHSNIINVSDLPEGLYNISIIARDIFGYEVSRAFGTVYLDFSDGYYEFINVSYPNLIPAVPFNINVLLRCVGDWCDFGHIHLLASEKCSIATNRYDIPILEENQTYLTSFLLSCNYTSLYPFVLYYGIVNGFLGTHSFIVPSAYTNIFYNISDSMVRIFISPVGYGTTVTYNITIRHIDPYMNVVERKQTISAADTRQILAENIVYGRAYTIEAVVDNPSNFRGQSFSYGFTIYSNESPVIKEFYLNKTTIYYPDPLIVCYNIESKAIITNLSLVLISESEHQTIFSESPLNISIQKCVSIDVSNYTNINKSYLIYLVAENYEGYKSTSWVLSFNVKEFPEIVLDIKPSDYIKTRKPSETITVRYIHPDLESVLCYLEHRNETFTYRLFNNTEHNIVLYATSVGENLYLLRCPARKTLQKTIIMLYDNIHPVIKNIFNKDNYLLLELEDNIMIDNATIQYFVNNDTLDLSTNIKQKQYILAIPLMFGNVSIYINIYDIVGNYIPFKYAYLADKLNITVVSEPSGAYIIKAPLIVYINATPARGGINIELLSVGYHYPHNCTIYPFEKTVIVTKPVRHNYFINITTPGIYNIYAICTDTAYTLATSNNVILEIKPEILYLRAGMAIAVEPTMFSFVALALITVSLGILFKSRRLLYLGIMIAVVVAILSAIIYKEMLLVSIVSSIISVVLAYVFSKVFVYL